MRLANGLEQTVQRRTEELRSADDRFASLVDSSEDTIIGTDQAGLVSSWNPAAERLYGYTAPDILGRPISVVVPPSGGPAGSVELGSRETEAGRRDGTSVPIALTISPILRRGVVVGTSMIGRDITERRQRDAEMVAARSEALAASRAKSDFLATMSHEIRTPMNGVIGLTELLMDTSLDEVQRRYAAGVRGAGEALLAIIDDILDFSKLEAGKVELEAVDFDPRQLVEDIGVLLAAPAGDKGLELVAYCDPDLPAALRGDPGRLRQILINLASNAVKFTASGEVSLLARTTHRGGPPLPGECVEVVFEICDTGIGVTPAQQERLFQPFTQADASTTRRYGGTGLGLAICKRLVTAMDGELALTSVPGSGSTFSATVPLRVAAATPSRAGSPPELLRGVRTLVVDDNETNRLVLAAHLAAWQIQPVLAADAQTGLELARDAAAAGDPFRLAVLDLCMPGMDGLELAAAMGADPALAAVKTMILTSAGPLPSDRAAQAGVGEWASKPVRFSGLYNALLRLVGPATELATPASTTIARGASRGHVLVARTTRSISWSPKACWPSSASLSPWRPTGGRRSLPCRSGGTTWC